MLTLRTSSEAQAVYCMLTRGKIWGRQNVDFCLIHFKTHLGSGGYCYLHLTAEGS